MQRYRVVQNVFSTSLRWLSSFSICNESTVSGLRQKSHPFHR